MTMVRFININENVVGQRIDNFLFTQLKGVPKSRIYKGLRKGEFRVNSKRVTPNYHLCLSDRLRIPPLRLPQGSSCSNSKIPFGLLSMLESRVLYEDEGLLVINKPSGIPVHGGSGVSWGLIELLRQLRPQSYPLELIHRLDRGTSGCLLIAKKRPTLLEWHHLLRHRQIKKVYTLLVKGCWQGGKRYVDLPLKKNVLKSGERIVTVSSEGKPAMTCFTPLQCSRELSLLSAELHTGRTHQIRVHAAAIGHPLVVDKKYGDQCFNRKMRKQGLDRLFLHAESVAVRHAKQARFQKVKAPLDKKLQDMLNKLRLAIRIRTL